MIGPYLANIYDDESYMVVPQFLNFKLHLNESSYSSYEMSFDRTFYKQKVNTYFCLISTLCII